ncbi:RNA polymerase sigma factor [Lederbergia lenta]|uniref:RNA polymerase sigma-70 factor, ECF subfamily n=1 Tax=Lederbergia lenta TaxID=1467 RepID=A0A2X4WGB2_LEDLE|nr:RNA polymerase sigma factor [Lederbergia lenta]MCM3113073.1 RNA polymerase sigma factor [Lederbergia lenta]MEC2322801.1 RNA polymerase sigma factor [Lederbergia lenta]SQI61869.1 RNA polymerase sigma-70 factor, ECF subfamily [Lederbergia lenta]
MNFKNDDLYIIIDQEGNMQSIDTIYLTYKNQLYRFIFRYSNDRQFSIDVVQDTFEKLIRKKHYYTSEKGSFKTYLFQIAYNTMMTKLKRRRKFAILLPFLAPDRFSTIAVEEKMSVQKAVQTLPEGQRAVIVLRYYHDLPQKEIAEVLGIPIGTVKSRLHHALKNLKDDLGVDKDG